VVNLKILDRAEKAFNNIERRNAESEWRLISEYIMPNQSGLFSSTTSVQTVSSDSLSTTPGTKKTKRLRDSTAVQANRDLASAIHGALTNPSMSWIKAVYSDEAIANDPEASRYLERANDIVNKSISESNFHTEISKAYTSLTGLANAALLVETDNDGELMFKAQHLANVAWEENYKGRVDTTYINFKLTAEQAAQKFGEEQLGKDIQNALKNEPCREFEFVHCIKPRSEYKEGLTAGINRKYASIYVSKCDQKVVKEDGYYEFPMPTARFELLAGEKYGRGPGHISLPDVRSLNALRQEEQAGAALMNRPPLEVLHRDILGTLSLSAGSMLPVRQKGAVNPLNIGLTPGITTNERNELKESIKRAYFLDKLLLPPRNEIGEMTAAEVRQRAEEIQRVFGPVAGRLMEWLSEIAVRVFNIKLREGAFGKVPAILAELDLNVELRFENQFAKAQELEEVSNILGFTNDIAMLAQVKPEVLDYYNADQALKRIAKARGIPDVLVQEDEAVQELRDMRQQQIEQQQMLEAGVGVADIQSKTQ
jgi:hypothetical protein